MAIEKVRMFYYVCPQCNTKEQRWYTDYTYTHTLKYIKPKCPYCKVRMIIKPTRHVKTAIKQ